MIDEVVRLKDLLAERNRLQPVVRDDVGIFQIVDEGCLSWSKRFFAQSCVHYTFPAMPKPRTSIRPV